MCYYAGNFLESSVGEEVVEDIFVNDLVFKAFALEEDDQILEKEMVDE